ncbi:MAG: toxic anion resistance protein [Acidimicrobiia bacterium]
MSELDLNASSEPSRSAAAATPSAPGTDLALVPPAPVPVVGEEQAAGMLPLDDAVRAKLDERAAAFAAELALLDVRSPEFTKKIDAIATMGDSEIRASASVSNRMLERPASALAGAKGSGGDPTAKVAKTLTELRETVTELDPARADLTGAKKILKFLPGGDKLKNYFGKYQSAQSQLDAIIKALASGQDELRKDNGAIEAEKANMWSAMAKLSEYATLGGALDSAVSAKVAELGGQGRADEANTLTSDALFPIRQRRQDILTQLAVSAQGYLALDLVRKNNIELIKGVDRAQTTTVSALRTAVIVAQALANQQLVLDQVTALNTSTSAMIQSTSELLKVQGTAINEQAAGAVVSIDALKVAFENVFATMDAIDSYKAQAVSNMASTVGALEEQIARSRQYLERTHRDEIGSGPTGS